MPASYNLDITGIDPNNLVVNEVHMVTEINSATYDLIIPKFGPFYLPNFNLEHLAEDGSVRPLYENTDYVLVLPFVGGIRSLGQVIYGGISISTLFATGALRVTYQTLGGSWTADSSYVLEYLANRVYNPRVTTWDLVTNVQQVFPPIAHNNDFNNFYGQEQLIESINQITAAIVAEAGIKAGLWNHIADNANPHNLHKEQLGLGYVENLALTDINDVFAENPTNTYVTLAQVITLINIMRPR